MLLMAIKLLSLLTSRERIWLHNHLGQITYINDLWHEIQDFYLFICFRIIALWFLIHVLCSLWKDRLKEYWLCPCNSAEFLCSSFILFIPKWKVAVLYVQDCLWRIYSLVEQPVFLYYSSLPEHHCRSVTIRNCETEMPFPKLQLFC
jgi:hypothetical protein